MIWQKEEVSRKSEAVRQPQIQPKVGYEYHKAATEWCQTASEISAELVLN